MYKNGSCYLQILVLSFSIDKSLADTCTIEFDAYYGIILTLYYYLAFTKFLIYFCTA